MSSPSFFFLKRTSQQIEKEKCGSIFIAGYKSCLSRFSVRTLGKHASHIDFVPELMKCQIGLSDLSELSLASISRPRNEAFSCRMRLSAWHVELFDPF